MDERTLSTLGEPDHDAVPDEAIPVLYLVLDCDHPVAPGLRLSLASLDQLLIGRGTSQKLEVDGHTYTLRINDARASRSHARLVRKAAGWVVEDLDSKNGTLRNGELCKQAPLFTGDILEIGRTLFLFRTIVTRAPPLLLESADLAQPLSELATYSQELARQLARMAQVARTSVPVLILGETGTGKEVVARALHHLSRRPGPFVAVNCAALPANLAEAELFGFRKGSFSGADESRIGLIRSADGGTLMLDELGDMPPALQTALLRVLQERCVVPIGTTRPIPVDLRIVSATHRNLTALKQAGLFREDLFARLAGISIHLQPLRERPEDLSLLIPSLIRRANVDPDRCRISGSAARALFNHTWPLNVRELEQCLTAALALAEDNVIQLEHLPDGLGSPGTVIPQPPRQKALLSDEEQQQRGDLGKLLHEHGGNVAAVARAVSKSPMQVYRWINRYGILLENFRPRKS